eukprot:11795353-Alexandrium_andersonii.AAC.1
MNTSLPSVAYYGALGIPGWTAPVELATWPAWKPNAPRVTLHQRGQRLRQHPRPACAQTPLGEPGD